MDELENLPPNSQSTGQHLPNASRGGHELAKLRQMRAIALKRDIVNEWANQDYAAAALAAKHGKKPVWMQSRLQRLSHYKAPHAINRWNALLHTKSMKIKNGKLSFAW